MADGLKIQCVFMFAMIFGPLICTAQEADSDLGQIEEIARILATLSSKYNELENKNEEIQAEIYRVRMEALCQDPRVEELTRKMESLGLTTCHIEDLLLSRPEDEKKSESAISFLTERLDEHEKLIKTTEQMIKDTVSIQVTRNSLLEKEVHAFAVRLASHERVLQSSGVDVDAVEGTLSAIQKQLNVVHSELETHHSDIGDLRKKLRLAELEYNAIKTSFCDRLTALEQQVAALGGNRVAGKAVFGEVGNAQRAPMLVPVPDNGPQPIDLSTVTPNWSTDPLAVCEGAELLQKCFDWKSNVQVGNEVRTVVRHGDLYRNCNGEIILLLHSPQAAPSRKRR